MPFDREKACNLIRKANELVFSNCPTGADEWIRTNRDDLFCRINDAGKAVDAAILSDNASAFLAALESYIRENVQAHEIYRQVG